MGSFVGKNCAQPVCGAAQNTGEAFPHLPHSCVQNSADESVVCTKTPTFATFVPVQPTAKYTAKIAKLTDAVRGLSPVSTVPIITTITYI